MKRIKNKPLFGMNKAAYYKYSYWGVVQSTIYIIVLDFIKL